MACICQYHGLRVSELLGLKWKDVDWFNKSVAIERLIVCQIEDEVKTPESAAVLPLDDEELELLKSWRKATEFTEPENYIFASPHLGAEKPARVRG